MNWEAIGAVGEVGGAVAVVGTLIYLATQIRHSSESTLASTQFAIQAEYNRMHEVLVQDRDLLATLEKVRAGVSLESLEERVFYHYTNRLFNQWIAIQTARDHGSVDDDYYEDTKADIVRACRQWPGLESNLREMLSQYPKRWEVFEPIYRDKEQA